MNKIFYTFLISGVLCLALWGCSDSEADTPIFTTADDRDTGFTPSSETVSMNAESDSSDPAVTNKQNDISDTVNKMKVNQATYDSELDSALAGIGSSSFGSSLSDSELDLSSFSDNSESMSELEGLGENELELAEMETSDLSFESSLSSSDLESEFSMNDSDFSEQMKEAQAQMEAYASNDTSYSIDMDEFFSGSSSSASLSDDSSVANYSAEAEEWMAQAQESLNVSDVSD